MYSIVEPTKVREVWQMVKPGLEHILRKSPENWIPEDVYAALVANRANLWLAIENDRMVGFVVGYVQDEDFHVWCAYGHLSGNLKRWFSELEDIAKTQCTRIVFDSWRSGWNRVAKELGFMPRRWAKEL
jgi:hypothetical protein